MYSKFLLVFILVLSCSLYGQKFANSPFSSYNIGEFGSLENATYIGYGHAAVGVADSLSLNYFNPASYSFLGHGQPLFSTGISYRNSLFSQNDSSFFNHLTGVDHFAFAVPFAKICGIAFGLKPFSRVGYDITEYSSLGMDTVKYNYRGRGSINDAFLGLSLKVLNLKKHQLGIGTNLSYLFGSIVNERISNLQGQSSGGLEYTSHRVKSLYYTLGLTYKFQMNDNKNLILGLTYQPGQSLTAYKTQDLYYMTDVSNNNMIDDTISAFYEEGTITLPAMYDIGFSYHFQPKVDSSYNKEKVFHLNIYGSYQVQNWSGYGTSFSNDSAQPLLNSSRIAFGVEFTPHHNYLDRSKNVGYLTRVRYRAGFQTGTLPVSDHNNQLKNRAVTMGMSFPIVSQRSVSSLNLGLSLGNKGSGGAGSLNERYIGVNFGITLAPGSYDKWFRKYKID